MAIRKISLVGIGLITLSVIVPLIIRQEEKSTIIAQTRSIDNYLNKTPQSANDKYDYIAVLEIPKISLMQGLIDTSSKYNDVNYNIQILDTSSMPDIVNSNLILASHSGNSQVSYFKDLYKLAINDDVYLYYNDIKYHYQIANIYEILKTGWININRNKTKTTMTLTTCKPDDDTKQLIYISYLIDKISY